MWVILTILLILVMGYSLLLFLQSYIFPKKVAKILSLIEDEQYSEARTQIDKLPDSRKDTSVVKWCSSQVNIGMKQYVMAMVELQDILKRKEYDEIVKEANVHESLALAYEKTGRMKEAATELQLVSIIDPNNYEVNFKLGKIHFDNKKYDLSKNHLLKALKSDPKNAEINYMLALLADKKRDTKEAISRLSTCIKHQPGYYKAHMKMGEIYYSQKSYDKASNCFGQAKKGRNYSTVAQAYEGLSFYNMKNYEDAVSLLERSEAQLPKMEKPYLNVAEALCDIYIKTRDVTKAESLWESVLELYPESVTIQNQVRIFHGIIKNQTLLDFFALSVEDFDNKVKRIVEKNKFYIEDWEKPNEDEIIIGCSFSGLGQAKGKLVLAFNRTPDFLDIVYLKKIFAKVKNVHATHGYIFTPFGFEGDNEQFVSSHPIEPVSGEAFAKVINGESIY